MPVLKVKKGLAESLGDWPDRSIPRLPGLIACVSLADRVDASRSPAGEGLRDQTCPAIFSPLRYADWSFFGFDAQVVCDLKDA